MDCVRTVLWSIFGVLISTEMSKVDERGENINWIEWKYCHSLKIDPVRMTGTLEDCSSVPTSGQQNGDSGTGIMRFSASLNSLSDWWRLYFCWNVITCLVSFILISFCCYFNDHPSPSCLATEKDDQHHGQDPADGNGDQEEDKEDSPVCLTMWSLHWRCRSWLFQIYFTTYKYFVYFSHLHIEKIFGQSSYLEKLNCLR